MNPKILIDRKASQLQKQLTQWAEKKLTLLPGEKLAFTLELVRGPTVIRAQSTSLLRMQCVDYFTDERFINAGIQPANQTTKRIQHHFRRLTELTAPGEQPSNVWRSYLWMKTIGGLISKNKSDLLKHGWGPKIVSVIEKTLRRDGIVLNE